MGACAITLTGLDGGESFKHEVAPWGNRPRGDAHGSPPRCVAAELGMPYEGKFIIIRGVQESKGGGSSYPQACEVVYTANP